jgi:hypothetical protein
MTPDRLRDEARFLGKLAVTDLVTRTGFGSLDKWKEGRAAGLRDAARWLREVAASEEGYEVGIDPRSVKFGRRFG